ncbi:hypothetical protein LCGC14_2047030 [marine sediment metagenome]|uniref:AP2/ERF domain-containing protein n=1 Tax=marine sediment metagenome TaxID=412755 RepID=A0A0F9H3J9_9ZZZZ
MVADTKTTRKTFKPKTNRVKIACRKDSPESSCQPPTASPARFIPLTQGYYAIVDADKYKWLMRWKWCAQGVNSLYTYAVRSENGKIIRMHRQILECKDNEHSDHKNHNTLDNRIINLRKCTIAQNQYNAMPRIGTSKYKGVYRQRNKWHAEVVYKGKHYHLGFHKQEIDAAKAYDRKAKELFGEFAYINFFG